MCSIRLLSRGRRLQRSSTGRITDMRALRALPLCLLLSAGMSASARAQTTGPVKSLEHLLNGVQPNDARTLATFWDAVRAHGTPLSERVAGDSTRMRVSFVWRSDSARNVILENGVNGW